MTEINSTDVTQQLRNPSKTRVLIVDDNIEGAESLAQLIEMWGHDCRVAFTGKDALRLAPEVAPRVVLLDINLPGMDGFAVARALRSSSALGSAWIYAVTGFLDEDEHRLVGEAGFDHVLIKPIDLTWLETDLAGLATRENPRGTTARDGRDGVYPS